MTTTVESARGDWEDGHRRFLAERDPTRVEALHRQLEVVTDELRRRVGQTFSLAELAAAYALSEAWARDVIAELAPTPRWPRTVTLAVDEAFHRYSRGAVDYVP